VKLTAEPALRRFWCPVADSAVVRDEPVAARLLGEHLVLWRPSPGAPVSAAIDRCPHRYARLTGGWLDGGCLVCPYHGWEYDGTGAAVRIPQLEDGAPIPTKAHLDMVHAVDRYGWVWACLDPDPLLDIADIVEHGADGWRAIHEPQSDWDCPAVLIIENNLDPAHIAFVHRASFGSPKEPGVPVSEVERRPGWLQTRYTVPVQSQPGDPRPTVRRTTTTVHGPFLAMIRIEYPDGLQHLMIKACTPVDDDRTVQFQTVLRNDAEAARPSADIVKFDAQVWDEDRAVLEPAAVNGYPLDLTKQVHLRFDRPTIEYRRMLADVITQQGATP
jgi:phenylpropionate dioxygenase-like ring-hydroxylating dioxygenase large terminal subunit